MVDVSSKRCAHATCTRRPSFNVLGSKISVYCKQHAQDGMVDVGTWPFFSYTCRPPLARGVPHDNETSASTAPDTDNLDVMGGIIRNRSSWPLDGQHHPHDFCRNPLNGEVAPAEEMGPSKGDIHASPSRAFQRRFDDDTVGMAIEQTRRNTPDVLVPLPEQHQPGEPIKTEMELVVLL